MPAYCITLERRVRFSQWFEAPNDELAQEEAEKMHFEAKDIDYEFGESEYDYAVVRDDGKDIVYWR